MCHCSSAISPQGFGLQRENYRGLGHAVDRFVHGIQSRFNFVPLLNHGHPHVFEFRNHGMVVPSRENMAPSFEDTLPSGTCILVND